MGGMNMRENLKKARKEKNMTQKQVAEYLNIAERYYKQIESGERLGSVEIWDNLEDLFNFDDQDNKEEEEDKEVRMEINRGPGKRQRKPNSLFFSDKYLNPVG